MSLLIKGQEHHIFGSPDTCFNSLMTWIGSGSKLASHGLLEWWRADSWREYHYGVSTPLWNSNAPGSFFGTSPLQSGHPNRIVFLSVCMTGSSSVVFGSRVDSHSSSWWCLRGPHRKLKKICFSPKVIISDHLQGNRELLIYSFFLQGTGDSSWHFCYFSEVSCHYVMLQLECAIMKKKLLFTNNSTLY